MEHWEGAWEGRIYNFHKFFKIVKIVIVTIYRPFWAEVREKYFSSGSNRKNMEAIEKAAFVFVLDDGSPNVSLYVSIVQVQCVPV